MDLRKTAGPGGAVRARGSILAIALAAGAPAVAGAPAITRASWRAHPEVVAVRELYVVTEASRSRGELKGESMRFGCPEQPYAGGDRTVYRDSAGRIRILGDALGSEDSAMTVMRMGTVERP